jgi:uncharacterized membrane protein HdeD (DUF308 family)
MDMNRYSESDRIPGSVAKSTPDHWVLFIGEGVVLILLGLLAMTIPLIANENVTGILGWLFLASGVTGLATTYWARKAPGFLWSLLSALLAILVGVVLIENKAEDLYGGLLGWPFHDAGPLRTILAFFFLIEGGVSVMFAVEHRRQFSTRWASMFASGVVDIVLASVIIFALPGTSGWTMGLLVAVNMVVGGAALIAIGIHARTEWAGAKAIRARSF